MILERLTRDDVRAIKVGQTGTFTLPNAKAVESARVQVSQLKRFDGMEFERLKSADPLTLVIKRLK